MDDARSREESKEEIIFLYKILGKMANMQPNLKEDVWQAMLECSRRYLAAQKICSSNPKEFNKCLGFICRHFRKSGLEKPNEHVKKLEDAMLNNKGKTCYLIPRI